MVKPGEKPSPKGSKDEILSDPRFSHLVKDPRFKNLPKNDSKVKIDKRFQSMFTDKKFKVKHTVDKYGRPVNTTSTEDLKKFYDIETSDEEDEVQQKRLEEKQIAKVDDVKKKKKDQAKEGARVSEEKASSSSGKADSAKDKVDYARGVGLITDSSDGESSEDDNETLHIEHGWGALDHDAETTNDSTRRLAVCNMDWDRVRASDIMVLCSSFLPPGGSVNSVKIYVSEYGRKRLAEEELHGPPELIKRDRDKDVNEAEMQEQDSDAEEGDDFHMEKLRQYQLNRLKYYYAVVECDSIETADKIYQECDGIEYESSATKVDLRFIPDETTFNDKPHDICTQLPEHGQYKPRQFTTTALQQANVDLTWDETSLERKELGEKLLTGRINEVKDSDLRKVVAYSSEEEEQSEPDGQPKPEEQSATTSKQEKTSKTHPLNIYKALLQEIIEEEEELKRKKANIDKEMSWNIEVRKEPEKSDEAIPEPQDQKQLTQIEKIIEKRSIKNKTRKIKRKNKNMKPVKQDGEASDDSNLSLHEIDMNDPYFAEEFAKKNFIYKPTSMSKMLGKPKSKEANEKEKDNRELQLLMEDDEDEKAHFSLMKLLDDDESKARRRKNKRRLNKSGRTSAPQSVIDSFKLDVADKRFKEIFSSHNYNIDPTDPHFKNTKGMQQLMEEKMKRRSQMDNESNISLDLPKPKKKKIQNKLLVDSLKKKIQNLTNN